MILRRPRAITSIEELAEYIGQDSPAAADRFIDATEQTFQQLETMPGMGHRHESEHPKLAEIRVWPVKGFRNYLVFYRPVDGGIEVMVVLHGARDLEAALDREL